MDTRKGLEFTTVTAYLAEQQYTASNYSNRNIYHCGYNIDRWQWLGQCYQPILSAYDCILELGCGDGKMWQHCSTTNLQAEITLSDCAQNMLASCKANLAQHQNFGQFQFEIADINRLPANYGIKSMDCIITNNVMYHAEDPLKTLTDCYSILKSSGLFALSVLNKGVNEEIWQTVHRHTPAIPAESFTSRFTDVNARQLLPKFFDDINEKHYLNKMKYDSAQTIMKMVTSSPTVQPLKLPNTFFTELTRMFQQKIDECGPIECEFNATLFLCRK